MKNGWQTRRFGDVCEFKKESGEWKNLPYVGLEDIESNSGRFLGSTSPLTVKSMTFRFTPEHVLYGRLRPYLNKVLLPDFEGHCSTEIFPIRTSDELERRYLFHWLRSDEVVAKINATWTGARMPRANMNQVLDFPIPVPPIEEQRRIVAILDEAFACIDKAKATTEKNIQNARELFDSYLNNIFSNPGPDWEEDTLGNIATFRNGINFTKSSRGETMRIVGVKDFQKSFWAPIHSLESITADGSVPESDLLKENDILFVRSNGNKELIGRSLLVGPVEGKVTHSGFTIRARIDDTRAVPQYVCRYVKSDLVRQRMIEGGTGTNIKSLNQSMLSDIRIPLPPVCDQQDIIARLEGIDGLSKTLDFVSRRKLVELDEVKKSILQKAFSAEL